MTGRIRLALVLFLLACTTENCFACIELTLFGESDNRNGFQVGGVAAPIGTPFSVRVLIDDSDAASGIYPILSVSGDLGGTPFTTEGPWDIEPLHAIQVLSGVSLRNVMLTDPGLGAISSAGEFFFLRLSRVQGIASDPLTWFDPVVTGDLGVGSPYTNIDISSEDFYLGRLEVSTRRIMYCPIPEPASIAVWGILGVLTMKRFRLA